MRNIHELYRKPGAYGAEILLMHILPKIFQLFLFSLILKSYPDMHHFTHPPLHC